ncbi:MAG TPA: glycosyltransferase family 39 protein [Polyangiaceae bacterium]|jgi:hypothetical protein|nr:glycosyltransferase family 39 protein [Polyangiaceae bacterium]
MSRAASRISQIFSCVVTAAVAATLISGLFTALWWGQGRYEFNTHYDTADQMLGFGESRFYVLCWVLGLPAGLLIARHFVHLPALHRLIRWRFWQTRLGLLVPAAIAALGSLLIAHFVIHYAWFTDDEQAYLHQANTYAQWHLTAPMLQPKALFRQLLMVEVLPKDGVPQWTGVYPPFQPFLMALSSRLGSFHLSQFLCVGLIVYNTGRLAQRLFESTALGAIAAWLCATSPMLVGLGSTVHTSILGTLLTLFVARLLLATLDRGGLGYGFLLGLVSGSMVLARPLEGTLVTGLTGLTLLYAFGGSFGPKGEPWKRVVSLISMGLGGLIPLAILVRINMTLTGHPFQGAYSVLEKSIGRFMGFGTGMMWGRVHSPALGLLQTATALVRVNAFAFGWPLSLGLVGVALFKPFRERRVTVLLCLSAIHVACYFSLAFGSVHDFGHAYHVWHVPIISMVSAWVILRFVQMAEAGQLLPEVNKYLRLGLGSMIVVAVAVFWPAEIRRWRDVSNIVLAPVRAATEAANGYPAIVLWQYIQAPSTRQSWVFAPPAPLPDGKLWWAYDSPAWYPELKRRYPDRVFLRLTWTAGRPHVVPAKI